MVAAGLAFATAAHAQSATWAETPTVQTTNAAGTFSDYNAPSNWVSGLGPPTDTATFGATSASGANIGFSNGGATVLGWTFSSGAANYTFTLADTPSHVGQTLEFDGAGIEINGGSATINLDGTTAAGAYTPRILFFNNASAGSAVINNTYGGIVFNDNTTADHAIITSNSTVNFENNSSAGDATITMTGFSSILFENGSPTAANATINLNGAFLFFVNNATGGNATINNNDASDGSNGFVDFSGSSGPAGDHKLSVGSIAGTGQFYLGANNLTVGSNNLSTTVSGVISDCGPDGNDCYSGETGGALTKVGEGTLTLTGANTYTGGTTVSGGTLLLSGAGTLGSTEGTTTITGGTLDLGGTTQTQGLVNLAGGTLANGALDAPISSTGGTINGIDGLASLTTAAGTTTLLGANAYTGATTVNGGTLEAGGVNVFSAVSHTVVASGGTLDLHGFDQTLNNGLENAGLVQLGVPGITPPGTTLTVAGGYVGNGGTLNVNTYLGADNSPSDKLILSGGSATGSTNINVTNVGGPGLQTTANGILVVNAINGATTATGAFTLANPELRAGSYTYLLFQGNAANVNDPTATQNWFLRSDFVSPGGPRPPPGPGPSPPPPPPILPPTPPPTPLPPGVLFPIIGPEIATYGVVQPLARELGLSIMGTLDDRVGDTYEPDGCAVQPAIAPGALPTRKPGPALAPCPLFAPSVWGRFFGQTIDNRYQAFADPSASGNLGGFQGGIDLLRGSLMAGQYERAGLYGAYGDASVNVDGLVTNPAATEYVNTRTGSVNLTAWSAGGYWTHVGPGGWYLDAVLQGTWYGGSASTQFARLETSGTGFIASLESGVPFAFPQLGWGFVLEPQGQILWQKVSFGQRNDGLGEVALGDTTGPSGRVGLRGKWTVVTGDGQVWQPYLRANLWQNWGPDANTVYSGTDMVPLITRATLLEFGGGLTGKINANVSVFANVDYEFQVGGAYGAKQNGVRGAFGARYEW